MFLKEFNILLIVIITSMTVNVFEGSKLSQVINCIANINFEKF